MKNRTWGAFYLVVGAFSFFIFLLFWLVISFFPIIRKFTVFNKTNQTVFVTPLIEFGGRFDVEAEESDSIQFSEISQLSVLPQYTGFSNPTFPALTVTDLKVNPLSSRVIYIDYEDLKQEEGVQLLLVKTEDNKHFYTQTDFWSHTTLVDVSKLIAAPDVLVTVKETHTATVVPWLILAMFFLLSVWFFYKAFQNFKRPSLQSMDLHK